MSLGDQSYLSDNKGIPDEKGKFVTYKALPCPLPEAWANEFKKAEDIVEILAIEKRCRESIGFQVTRKYIPPVNRL